MKPLSEVSAKNGHADTDWWRGAVIYQIYPRSFQDSRGDGTGDLSGIIQRLDYIADLGADAIWISPFFKSPMADFGYDVSDYRDIDPLFGTLCDFDALVARAHELGLKVLIDLVMSHTSSEHSWFKESRSSRTNSRADWYVWADAQADGTPPNNWLSIFGGSAWEWDGERMQYYLHNFLTSQPDLNFHNPEVRQEMLDVARFWLERGVDGFRLDTVNFYFHDKELRSNPALNPDEINDKTAPSVNPYNFQNHIYSKNRPENIDFLEKLRGIMDEYPGTTSVGEVGEAQRGAEIQAEYTRGDKRLHMCYDFDFLSNVYPSGPQVAQIWRKFDAHAGEGGWACWAYSNHDVVRHASRWSLGDGAQRLLMALLVSLRGSVCLYQGEELGLPEASVPFEDLQDPYGKRFWPKFKGRDGCRTPMPWSGNSPGAGFTAANVRPWLPIATEHLPLAADRQLEAPDSLLNFYKAMLAFRRPLEVLRTGTLELVDVAEDFISFIRAQDGTRMFCAFNISDDESVLQLPDGKWRLIDGAPFEVVMKAGEYRLPPWQAGYFIED